jgi:hypothetical protein
MAGRDLYGSTAKNYSALLTTRGAKGTVLKSKSIRDWNCCKASISKKHNRTEILMIAIFSISTFYLTRMIASNSDSVPMKHIGQYGLCRPLVESPVWLVNTTGTKHLVVEYTKRMLHAKLKLS